MTPEAETVIPRHAPLPAAEDFAARKAEAIEWLWRWCGEQWTNFNENDPGLMLLDELIYASTELAYRASLPIPRLRGDASTPSPEDNALFPAAAVLPMQPVTAGDYARILYDRIPGLVYASVTPLPPESGGGLPLAGRFQVRFALDPRADSATEADALRQIRSLLAAQRNLGERFDDIAREPYVRVELRIRARLEAGADPAIVAANLHAAASRALTPGVRFRPLAEAAASIPLDTLLTGPRLRHGVLEDEDLPQRCTGQEARERVASALLGVRFVRDVLNLEFANASALAAAGNEERLFVLPNEIYVELPAPETADESGTRDLIVMIGAIPDESPVDDSISARAGILVAAGGEKPRRIGQADAVPVPTAGTPASFAPAASVADFVPLRDQLPACFALTPGSLPDDAPPERRAQADQLKGYLLAFEQFLANYLAQLAGTADFLSCRPQTRTVFTQPVADDDIIPLLAGFSLPEDTAAPAGPEFWNSPSNPYVAGLRAIAEDETSFRTRRGRALDHLLARFNESFPSSNLETFETIANREALLSSYPKIGYRRAAAADPADPDGYGGARPRSGLEEKIQLLLRRDTQGAPTGGAPQPADLETGGPTDFYFALETVSFLPGPGPAVAEGEAIPLPAEALAPVLYHVFVNWTFAPLTASFCAYAEARVLENAPAHLWHRFIWLETKPVPAPATNAFLGLFRDWAEAGYPTLQLRAAGGGATAVLAGTPAARLLQWLLDHAGDSGPRTPTT